jgi:DNA repair protein RadA/Sms
MSSFQCHYCDEPLDEGRALCPKCRRWQPSTILDNPRAPREDKDPSVLLSDVESAEKSRIDVGPFNLIFGGGIVQTSVTLIGGAPGAGKSTLLLQLSDIIATRTKREVLYIASEEALTEIRLRADRLKLKQKALVRMVPAMSGEGNIAKILSRHKPSAIILDSLQGFANEDHELSVRICNDIKKTAVMLGAPGIIISHVTKDQDFAGVMKLQHAVDALVTFSVDEEFGDVRTLEVQKNRNGRAFVRLDLEMTETGLVTVELEDEEEEEEEEEEEKPKQSKTKLKAR